MLKLILTTQKKGLNFLSYDGLIELHVEMSSWQKIIRCGVSKSVVLNCCFEFNNQNLKTIISTSINKNINSVEELEKFCFDTFLGKTKAQNNQKYSSYKDLEKTLYKRHDAFLEGKVSQTYFNQLCSTYEGSTDENGDMLKCNICLGELEIGAEVCRLPCGHLNCKTCIECWLDVQPENFDEYPYQPTVAEDNDSSVDEDNDKSVENNDTLNEKDTDSLDLNDTASDNNVNKTLDEYPVETADKDEDKNSIVNSSDDSKASDGNSDNAFAPDLEASISEEDTSSILIGSLVAVDNDTPSSDVYWNEYEVDDNEEQKARNQCPICKHICS